ncbi:MAG: hypothetical protein GY950_00695 [bacterium]|nr:hypothetical protein [bacterium]
MNDRQKLKKALSITDNPVDIFAAAMKEKLEEKYEKGGRVQWLAMEFADLTMRCIDETLELSGELSKPSQPGNFEGLDFSAIMHEAIDIGNFAMMIYDKALAERILENLKKGKR